MNYGDQKKEFNIMNNCPLCLNGLCSLPLATDNSVCRSICTSCCVKRCNSNYCYRGPEMNKIDYILVKAFLEKEGKHLF